MLSLVSWCGITLCEKDSLQVFAKLGGSRLGSIDKRRVGWACQDTSPILRNIQQEVSSFFKHPCRSFRHIVLFDGSVRLTPDWFAYHENLKTDARLVDMLTKATRLDVMWNEDDAYACQVINASAVKLVVNPEGTSIQANPSFECRRDVDNDSLVREHLWVPEFELVNCKDVVDYYWRPDYKRSTKCVDLPSTSKARAIKSIHVHHRAKTLGRIVGFPLVESFSMHRPGGLGRLDEQDLQALAESNINALKLVLWSILPAQIRLMTKLTVLKVEHTNSPDQEAQQVYKLNTVPSELGLLNNLTTLWLYGQGFQGDVPSELGRLSKLQELLITNTWVTSLPTELGELASLTRLDLSGNTMLRSGLPSCLLNKLDYLKW